MIDFKQIALSDAPYNLHSHTQFCDGRADMETFVKQAIALGFRCYGFSPHSPIPFPSPCNMKETDIQPYLAEVERLRSLYDSQIELFASMEIDYIDDTCNAASPLFRSLPLDYRISSIHFIHTQEGEIIDVDGSPTSFITKMHANFHDDIRYVVDTFYSQTLKMLETGGFDIVGHVDKIGNNASAYCPGIEEETWYKAHIDRLVEALTAYGYVVEINTKAWDAPVGATPEQIATYRPRLFPSPDMISRLAKAGVTMVINSDTHYPDRMLTGREKAEGLLRGSLL